MQRAHPCKPAAAPAHCLRPGKAAHHFRHDLGDHLNGDASGLFDHREIKVALLVLLNLRLFDRFQSSALEKAGNSAFRRADARPLLLFFHVRLPGRNPLHRQRQPPRSHESLGAFIDQTGCHQLVGDELAQILRGARLHACGNFFREKFEQKIGHDYSDACSLCSPPPACGGEGSGVGGAVAFRAS